MNAAPGFRLGQLASLPRTCVRHASTKPKRAFEGPDGHGEKIWVHAHRKSDQVIYSLKSQLEGHHDMKQLAFSGKHSKPSKLRKDYWYPMAIINFPEGKGYVGRSVFQKLRELKHLHEVSWSDDVFFKDPSEYNQKQKVAAQKKEEAGEEYLVSRHRKIRGKAINRQRLNSIADMAVILAGQGRGNAVNVAEGKAADGLVPVTVIWANDQDKEYAEEWSANVTHDLVAEPAYVLDGEMKAAVTTPASPPNPEPVAAQ